MSTINIPAGLKINSQIPLNVKEFCKDEDTLAYLGVDDNLAFTYHDQLEILCLAEKSIYIWREVQVGEENIGLVPLDFIYPTGLSDAYGINYSGKKYNFFLKEYVTSELLQDLIKIENVGTGVEIYKDYTIEGNNTQFNFRTITSTGGSITITQEADTINLEVDTGPTTTCLTSKNKTVIITEVEGCFDLRVNLPTSVNVGTGEDVYKTFNAFTNQNEFKTLKSNNNTISLSPSTDELSLEVNNLQKTINTFPYTLTDNDDKYTIFVNNGVSNVVINVPDGLISNFCCAFYQEGEGEVTIQCSGTSTLNYPFTTLDNKIKGQNYWAMIEKKMNEDVYFLSGNLLSL